VNHLRAALLAPGLLCAVLLAGCAAGDPAIDAGPFEIPRIDLSRLPDHLRSEAAEAERRALGNPADADAVGTLALHYLEYDFPLAAAACLERAALLRPRELKWPYYLAIAYEKAGDREGTLRGLDLTLAIDPDYAPALVRLGEALADADPSGAERAYRRARESNPGNAEALLGLGRLAEKRGSIEEAVGLYDEAIRLAPGFARAHYSLAMLLAARGDTAGAEEHLRLRAKGGASPSQDDPLLAEMRSIVAPSYLLVQQEVNRLIRDGSLDAAMELLRRSMATDVTGVTARRQLGEVLGLKGRYAEAAEVYRLILEESPADHESRTRLAQALEGMGDRQGAEREYRSVLEAHPTYAPALVPFGLMLARGERREEGMRLLRKGVAERPADGIYRYQLGVELARDGETAGAIEELARAADLMPEHAGVRFSLGQLRRVTGDRGGALQAWEEAVALAPGLAEAWIGLAELALDGGQPQLAVDRAERGCRAGGYGRRRHLEVLSMAYEAAGRPAEAREMRSRALGLP
jgi:tetratricopeptide (TPR) repeat protein